MSHNRDRPHVTKSTLDSSSSSATKDGLRQERVSRPGSSGPWDVSNDSSKNHAESYFSRREDRLSARKKAEEEMTRTDYKKMHEKALATNQRLKSRLETSKQELVVIQEQLQRAQQKELKSELGSNLLETDKKDSRSVRKKISDMEEQLKVKAEVETENQRLKDENGALIRVITKLSK
ncbi:protein phosphatase 1 regulatory subunit 12B-like isoform X1 [Nerophis lumbriciformis]|uniref:protein phosphatase 1 regulatory subunit 12B-like isoform X1 n=1 Tax=Nerophis lumbriciformis TaxID=546530 RepID=UPI002AE02569|nr:protein phosphatase 1 regulatory subunit 12B-like isoform X1 [Nerophis lumbriciformis]